MVRLCSTTRACFTSASALPISPRRWTKSAPAAAWRGRRCRIGRWPCGCPIRVRNDVPGAHHFGYWSDDVRADTESLLADGWTLELAANAPDEGYGRFT